MSEPLFRVGEEVILQSLNFPHLNGGYRVSKIRGVGCFLIHSTGETYTAYSYDLHPNPYHLVKGWGEKALRKKHKPSDESFSEMMKNLKKVTV